MACSAAFGLLGFMQRGWRKALIEMIEQVPPRELAAWLASAREGGTQPLLLDVREPAEWQAASVRAEGAELL